MKVVMPTRDAHDFEQRRQQIIDGALEVFSTKGFEKATNKDIAQAAGINSAGLIYHYFKDKADLFRQVAEQRSPALQLLTHTDELMDRPLREVLSTFGMAFVQTMQNRTTLAVFKLVLGEALRRPAVADMFNQLGPARGLGFLAAYFAHQMERGTIRRMDPGAAARCFVGPLLAYVITREVFLQPDAHRISPEAMVQHAVDIFLHGVEPATAAEDL
jgi:AcrR family transcriptional regulator